ncbi:hypothetical protein Y032_0794g2389 [Ancylostoma ceylanicum]|uniref:Uncharacterized protein n=1 Tax=Ancylostoma ceylanicum TaxID=53326 RepID=A0A016WCQ9_9BILA|nr:hypothetical protein Y032_0794g2389 [Ancylostoma ceylanicum]
MADARIDAVAAVATSQAVGRDAAAPRGRLIIENEREDGGTGKGREEREGREREFTCAKRVLTLAKLCNRFLNSPRLRQRRRMRTRTNANEQHKGDRHRRHSADDVCILSVSSAPFSLASWENRRRAMSAWKISNHYWIA